MTLEITGDGKVILRKGKRETEGSALRGISECRRGVIYECRSKIFGGENHFKARQISTTVADFCHRVYHVSLCEVRI